MREFGGYIRVNAASIPNYGELHRTGERISAAFAESINQVVSDAWSRSNRCAGHHAGPLGLIEEGSGKAPPVAGRLGRGHRNRNAFYAVAFAGDVSAPPYPPVDRDQVMRRS